jgi:hypothetical protein
MTGTRILLLETPPKRCVDLTGFKGGRLVITGIYGKRVYAKGGLVFLWKAKCSCGREVILNGAHFSNGSTQSCGCLCLERLSDAKKRKKYRRKYKDTTLPEPIRFGASDVISRDGAFVNLNGKVFGRLAVLSLAYGVLYFMHNHRSKNPKQRLKRHMVTYWATKWYVTIIILFQKTQKRPAKSAERRPQSSTTRGRKTHYNLLFSQV